MAGISTGFAAMSIVQQLGARTEAIETRAGAAAFCKIARLLLAAGGDRAQAIRLAPAYHASDRVTAIIKASITGGTMGDWSAVSDYVNVSTAFSESLRTLSCFDRMLGDGIVPAPLRSRGITVVTGIGGGNPGERMVKNIGTLTLGNALVEPRKSTAILVMSEEVAKSANASTNALLDNELRKGVASATDQAFLSSLIASTTPVASSGSTLGNITTDLSAMVDAVVTAPGSRLYFVASPQNLKKMLLKTTAQGGVAFPALTAGGGDIIPGIVALPSDQIGSAALLIDATGIAGTATRSCSMQASKHRCRWKAHRTHRQPRRRLW